MTARRLSRLSPRVILAAWLAAVGLILMGQGFYIQAKALLAQVLLERAFAASLISGEPTKPWSWSDTWPVARITVPRLGASVIALSGASGQALAFGPGHLSATPEPGERGTSVYAAHRDTHFAFLRELEPGDLIEVTRADRSTHRFRVSHTSIAAWNASGVDPAGPGRNLVLATCWPLEARTAGPLRYLVHATATAE
jgi:sortase A